MGTPGGVGGPLVFFPNETACRFHSIEAKCAFPRWCGYVWAVRAGQTGPGGDGGPWGSHVSYPSRHGDWWAPGGCFFNETACRFHLIDRGEICMGGVFMSGPIQAEPDQCEYEEGRMYQSYPYANHRRGPRTQKSHIIDAASTYRLVSIIIGPSPRRIHGRFSEAGLTGAAGPRKAHGGVGIRNWAKRAPRGVLVGPWAILV